MVGVMEKYRLRHNRYLVFGGFGFIWVLFPRGGGQWPRRWSQVVQVSPKTSAARVGVRGRQERAQARPDCLSGG